MKQDLQAGMNASEREVLANNLLLTRVSSAQKPVEIVINVPKGLNPDFKLYEPPLRGIWIESKGFIRDKMWYDTLSSMPAWLKYRYRVVITESGGKARNTMCDKLYKLGVMFTTSRRALPQGWYLDAFDLYTNGTPDLDVRDEVWTPKKGNITIVNKGCSIREALLQ